VKLPKPILQLPLFISIPVEHTGQFRGDGHGGEFFNGSTPPRKAMVKAFADFMTPLVKPGYLLALPVLT